MLVAALAAHCATATLPWLTVRPVNLALNPNSTRHYIISDEYGREVTLRGACVEMEERNFPGNHTQRSFNPADYANGACPQNYNTYQEPPICGVDAGKGKYNQSSGDLSGNDFAQMRALGFNIIRLCLSWSELESSPGVYDATYLARVSQLLDWAEEQDVYVILDLHEDDYSMYIYPGPNETGIPPILVPTGNGEGNDGAAAWAVDTGGFPSWAVLGIANLNLAMMQAFQQFWDNAVLPGIPQGAAPGPGLQDHYIGALAALARLAGNRSVVAGYEIINEPQPGWMLDPFTFADSLYALFKRCVQAITGIRDGLPTCPPSNTTAAGCAYPDLGIRDTRHLFFAEPSAVRNLLDFSPQVSVPWTNYTNIVHTPHTYTHVFTIDRILLPYGINISWYPPSFEFAYQTAWDEANAMQSAVFVTEFGSSTGDDVNTVDYTLDAQETYMTGATLWSWKSNCVSSSPGGCDWAWTVYFPADGSPTGPVPQNGPLDPERARLLSRTHVRGALGELLAYAYNHTTRSFYAYFNSSSGATGSSTAVAAPRMVSVSAAEYTPLFQQQLSGNGSYTEVYIPPAIPFTLSLLGPASLAQMVTWPDGSRTAYIQPTAPGVYGVLVYNSTGSESSSGDISGSNSGSSGGVGRGLARLLQRAGTPLPTTPTDLRTSEFATAAYLAFTQEQRERRGAAADAAAAVAEAVRQAAATRGYYDALPPAPAGTACAEGDVSCPMDTLLAWQRDAVAQALAALEQA